MFHEMYCPSVDLVKGSLNVSESLFMRRKVSGKDIRLSESKIFRKVHKGVLILGSQKFCNSGIENHEGVRI